MDFPLWFWECWKVAEVDLHAPLNRMKLHGIASSPVICIWSCGCMHAGRFFEHLLGHACLVAGSASMCRRVRVRARRSLGASLYLLACMPACTRILVSACVCMRRAEDLRSYVSSAFPCLYCRTRWLARQLAADVCADTAQRDAVTLKCLNTFLNA